MLGSKSKRVSLPSSGNLGIASEMKPGSLSDRKPHFSVKTVYHLYSN